MVEIVDETEIFITQEEYDKLYKLYKFTPTPSITLEMHGFHDYEMLARKHEKDVEKYENYRIYLSDKYNFELLRSDGSYFAINGLRVVYVLGGKTEFN